MDIVSQACKIYGNKLALSFNGGKESDIVLSIVKNMTEEVKIYYVRDENDFPELVEHVENMRKKYDFNLFIYNDMKKAIIDLKDNHGIEAILTGIRKSDPSGISAHFQKSDINWPEITIISPLLDWEYKDVWNYIISNNLGHCKLYEQGYTSIGVVGNTFPNYHLFDGNVYRHASELENGSYEREGRINFMLPISFNASVIRGKGFGNSILGIPTANLNIDNKDIGIIDGVYFGYTFVDDIKYKFVMSCGTNPQFGDRSFEVHIIDMSYTDLYSKKLTINITDYIRPMKKYNNIDDLKIAIHKDITIAKVYSK
jgi:FAD synthetase